MSTQDVITADDTNDVTALSVQASPSQAQLETLYSPPSSLDFPSDVIIAGRPTISNDDAALEAPRHPTAMPRRPPQQHDLFADIYGSDDEFEYHNERLTNEASIAPAGTTTRTQIYVYKQRRELSILGGPWGPCKHVHTLGITGTNPPRTHVHTSSPTHDPPKPSMPYTPGQCIVQYTVYSIQCTVLQYFEV